MIILGEDARIVTQANGENNSNGLGYGIYAGNRDRETEAMPTVSSAKVTVGNGSTIQTAGNKAYAVYANKTGEIELGNTTIVTTGQTAHGLMAEDGQITSGSTLCGWGSRPPCTTSTLKAVKSIWPAILTSLSIQAREAMPCRDGNGFVDCIAKSRRHTGIGRIPCHWRYGGQQGRADRFECQWGISVYR